MSSFYNDISINQSKDWTDLLTELKETTQYNPYCLYSDIYEVLKKITLSLLHGKEIVLLDADFSQDEINRLVGVDVLKQSVSTLNNDKIKNLKNKGDLLYRLKRVSKEWTITLFTSGTTGLPKKVTHSFQSISRFVKTSENKKENIWGFAYNPTHMAGLQVFFQALLNGNQIVRLFGLSKEQIFESIKQFKITNISATPTFYRLLLPAPNSFTSVEHITSGGEKFDEKTGEKLKKVFPNAKFTNIYASTEAGTLFSTVGNKFSVKPEITSFVKIENNELLIHQSLLGKADFCSSEWYCTGDMVEIISESPLCFQFVSRKNEMINVGGYKVNPEEVEETIRKITGIQDARVYAKNNSVLGNIICCEIVKTTEEINELYVRSFLQSKLQEFKIPRFISFTDKISTTRTGKIKRT